MKTSSISFFKAHISQELRSVRAGERIIIMDRDIPVAEVVPYEDDSVMHVRLPTTKLVPRALSFSVERDPLGLLMEERAKR